MWPKRTSLLLFLAPAGCAAPARLAERGLASTVRRTHREPALPGGAACPP